MTAILFEEVFGTRLEDIKEQVIFIGDSPNDVPMFRAFPHAAGVANVKRFTHRMAALPAYVTQAEGGEGFAEVVDALLR